MKQVKTRSKSKHEASRSTKQVEARSKSKHEASRNTKQVNNKDQSKCKNETKASVKMRPKQV